MRSVRDGGSGAKRRCHADNFCDLLIRCACLPRSARVDLNAVRTLCRERDRESHQFFIFARDRSILHSRFVECQNAFIASGALASRSFRCAKFFMSYIEFVLTDQMFSAFEIVAILPSSFVIFTVNGSL